jgi:tetratricopeptide (TPR) repeat protein
MEDAKVLHPSINQVVPHPENFLEISIINEIYHNIEQIDYKCRGQVGDDIVNLRIRQMAYSKILVNVYGKPAQILAKSLTNLGIAYFDISYFEQATEHIFQAFKLIQNTNDDMSVGEKEFQIKVLINLSKCYMEIDKLPASLSICQKCLELNQKIFGAKHVSNADIYYVLAKVKYFIN